MDGVEDEAVVSYDRDEDESDDEVNYKELDLDGLNFDSIEIDSSIITKRDDKIALSNTIDACSSKSTENNTNGELVINSRFLVNFCSKTIFFSDTAIAINENLFTEQDLEGLEDELEDLDIEEDD